MILNNPMSDHMPKQSAYGIVATGFQSGKQIFCSVKLRMHTTK